VKFLNYGHKWKWKRVNGIDMSVSSVDNNVRQISYCYCWGQILRHKEILQEKQVKNGKF
jgi:hypothetical protein